MQKIKYLSVCLVILMISGAARAQSSVTLYGQIDVALLFTNKTINPATGQSSGKQFSLTSGGNLPSYFGIKGSEDLGGGFFVNFNLQSGISAVNGGFDDTNGNLFGRQAWLGLSGNFGETKVGVQYSPFLLAQVEIDARGSGLFGSAANFYGDEEFTGFFVSNALSYTSPNIYGFTGSVMYALGGIAGDFSAGKSYSASLKYEYKGLLVDAAIEDEANSVALNTAPLTVPLEARELGAAYNFGKVTIKASFTSYNAPLSLDDNIRSGGANNVYSTGYDYLITPQVDLNGAVYFAKDPNDAKSHALSVAQGAQYFLSRTTTLYAQLDVVNNSGTENIGSSFDSALSGVHGTTIAANIGMRHDF